MSKIFGLIVILLICVSCNQKRKAEVSLSSYTHDFGIISSDIICRDSPNLDRVIRIKTSTCRGGLIENVFVRNVTVGQCREAVLRINLQYENREKCKRGFDPIVRNVHLKNVTCEKSKLGVLIIGLEDDKHVYNISVEDSHFNNVAKGANDIKGAKDVTFKNLYINDELVK